MEFTLIKQCLDQLEEIDKERKAMMGQMKKKALDDRAKLEGDILNLQDYVDDLEGEVKELRALLENSKGAFQRGGNRDSKDEQTPAMDPERARAYQTSLELATKPSFKSMIRHVFAQAMGISPTNMTGKFLPHHPRPNEPWPLKPGTDKPVIRFDWYKKAEDPCNWDLIIIIINEVSKNGGQYSPACRDVLKQVELEHIQERVVYKFKSLRKEYLAHNEGPDTVDNATSSDGEMFDLGGGENTHDIGDVRSAGPVAPKDGPQPVKNGVARSRADGKLQVRIRKRNHLPPDHPLRDRKYDPAFAVSLMSEDEDSYHNGVLVPNEFISRPPSYQSIEMQELMEELDKQPDPNPPKNYVCWIPGPVKEMPPPRANKIENKARRWMVSKEWLNKDDNSKTYDVPSCIIENGKAYSGGTELDPEEIEARQKRVKMEKADMKCQKNGASAGSSAKKSKGNAKGGKGKEKAKKAERDASDEYEDMYVD